MAEELTGVIKKLKENCIERSSTEPCAAGHYVVFCGYFKGSQPVSIDLQAIPVVLTDLRTITLEDTKKKHARVCL